MASTPLSEAAQQCIDHLKQQIDLAQALSGEGKSIRTGFIGTVQVLQKQKDDLEEWKKTIIFIQPGNDPKRYNLAIQNAADACSLIGDCINTIEATLEHAKASKSLPESYSAYATIDNALDHIRTDIAELNKVSALFRKEPLKNEIAQFIQQSDKLKDFFRHQIRGKIHPHVRRQSFSIRQRGIETQFGELDWFWRNLPPVKNLPKGLPAGNIGDGVIIEKYQVDRARSVLQRFRDAWIEEISETESAFTDRDKLLMLEKMPKIAMVLWVARKHGLFNIFLENEIDDIDMDNDDPKVRKFLGDDADYISAQYSRVRERQWDDKSHLELKPDEPLPLEHEFFWKKEPYTTVDKVKDSWHPERTYARKVLYRTDDFKTELINLMKVCNEDHGHHFVKYVKTYERGIELGVLLSPVATQTLNDLLKDCSRNPSLRRNNRPVLVRAFGCLTYSLCYMHNVKHFRHRDVKPHNILYLRKDGEEAEFMWTDFGLAKAFDQEAHSGTMSQGFRATPQYEAPEIGKEGSEHGRSADVFSLGCVFLEIIDVLSMNDRPTTPIRKIGHYRDHIKQLDSWAEDKIGALTGSSDKPLRKILELTRSMIKENPKDRLKIGKVALHLAKLKQSDKNTPHPFCSRCVARRTTDLSKKPVNPGIFEHKTGNWPKNPPLPGVLVLQSDITVPIQTEAQDFSRQFTK